ncbi:TetR/AcrR family transcriptional regulator [Streptomonospora wellingtoniae]|uniref:TetR family transcriptional regulator n=1 Tax=Streptomonospora wellingtoniae TaxID=3075544 RepID=A0ABU2L0M5_9ACTN|nr:TetR family transcriptional regulator [Streptomonospora sp. DSM 45055]MDT0304888.1 TetR family transcriptional regulator [Streptomonospora sp. DSM 45055]
MEPGSRPSGRRKRTFIEEARRAQIVSAAIRTVAEAGYANASLARIAQHAGISKGVISYHFSGKDELMDRVVEQIYSTIADFVLPRVAEAPDERAALRTHILAVADYMRSNREQLLALAGIFNGVQTPVGAPRYRMAVSEPVYRAIEERLRAGQERGVLRDFDVRVMAVSLQSAIDGMFAYWVTHPDHDLDAHAAELAELIDRSARPDSADSAGST